MTVLLDTNALMMPVECNVRVFEAVEDLLGDVSYVVPEAVLAELDRLADGAGEAATAASVGRDLARRCATRATEAESADNAVVELAQTDDVTHVVTNDQPLKRRLLDVGVPVICLRGQNKLAITQP
jgi:hypothetical protein